MYNIGNVNYYTYRSMITFIESTLYFKQPTCQYCNTMQRVIRSVNFVYLLGAKSSRLLFLKFCILVGIILHSCWYYFAFLLVLFGILVGIICHSCWYYFAFLLVLFGILVGIIWHSCWYYLAFLLVLFCSDMKALETVFIKIIDTNTNFIQSELNG